MLRQATANLVHRAQQTRSGMGAVNQAINVHVQQAQIELEPPQRLLRPEHEPGAGRPACSRSPTRRSSSRATAGSTAGSSTAARGDQPDRTVTIGSPEFMELVERLAAQNRQGVLSMSGEILLHVDGKKVLIKGP